MKIEQFVTAPSTIQPIVSQSAETAGIQGFVLREDLIHPTLNGNKWRKLKYNLFEARKQGKHHLVALGGPYSNLIKAVAAAGNLFGFQTTGIIRGEPVKNPALHFSASLGMQFAFTDRTTFRLWRSDLNQLVARFPDAYIIPEGGTNVLALHGVAEMAIPDWVDFVMVACGTGGTLAGLATSLLPHQRVLGVAVLKDQGYLDHEVQRLHLAFNSGTFDNWRIIRDFHGGGYAKSTLELEQFCVRFVAETHIPVEPVYTGKLFFAWEKLTESGFFPHESKVLLIHSGGLKP
jgi:1-aminocyclopropane-1-carboxylate deaminase/D-cysteine desulfhydrase-like pyridoxal-dependent ACC family enzyme